MISKRLRSLLQMAEATTMGPRGFSFANSEAETLVAAMSVEPDDDRKALIDDTIGGLKTSGLWTKYDELLVFAAHDVQAALLDWKNPSRSATRIGSCTFTADRGFTGNMSGGAGSMRIDAAANLVDGAIAGTDAHWSIYLNGSEAGDSNNLDLGDSSGVYDFGALLGNGNQLWEISGCGSQIVTSVPVNGTWICSAIGSGAGTAVLYKNGVSVDTAVNGEANPTAGEKLAWLGRGAGTNVWSFRRAAYGSYGTGLTAQNASDMHSVLLTYLTAVGAN